MYFETAGIETNPIVPILVGYLCALFLSWVGLTGAFLTLPFMISYYGYTSPSVSATNLTVNLIAPIGGIYAYLKEKRMAWDLGLVAGLGAILGSLIGAYLRIYYVYEPELFKAIVGSVMIFLGLRLFYETTEKALIKKRKQKEIMRKFSERVKKMKKKGGVFVSGLDREAYYKTIKIGFKEIKFVFWGEEFKYNPITLLIVGTMIGILGAMIGVGGAFLLAPYLTSIVGLPIYVVAGATLLYTYITSVSGVIFYSVIKNTHPDWLLGLLFGIGAMLGGYTSARLQKFMPEKILKYILGSILIIWGIRYVFSLL